MEEDCFWFKIYFLKFIYFENVTNVFGNLHLTFVLCSASQKYGEAFSKFCGLLRIYELYHEKDFFLWISSDWRTKRG